MEDITNMKRMNFFSLATNFFKNLNSKSICDSVSNFSTETSQPTNVRFLRRFQCFCLSCYSEWFLKVRLIDYWLTFSQPLQPAKTALLIGCVQLSKNRLLTSPVRCKRTYNVTLYCALDYLTIRKTSCNEKTFLAPRIWAAAAVGVG